MNWLDYTRKKKLFLGQPNSQYPFGGQQTPGDLFVPNKTIEQELITKSPLDAPETGSPVMRANAATPGMSAYLDYLKSEPQREDYQLNKVGKALASIAGFGEGFRRGPGAAYETASGIMERPYREAQEEYGRKGARLREIADIEYKTMKDTEKLAFDLADLDIKERNARREELDSVANRARTLADINRINRQARTIGYTYRVNENTGHLMRVDDADGSMTDLGKMGEGKAETRKAERTEWSFRNAAEFRQRMSLQRDAQNAARALENLRSTNDRTNAEALAMLRTTLGREDMRVRQILESSDPESQRSAYATAQFLALAKGGWTEVPDDEDDRAEFLASFQREFDKIMTAAGVNPQTGGLNPVQDPRNTAIQWLTDNQIEVNEETIKMAMEDLAAEIRENPDETVEEEIALPENTGPGIMSRIGNMFMNQPVGPSRTGMVHGTLPNVSLPNIQNLFPGRTGIVDPRHSEQMLRDAAAWMTDPARRRRSVFGDR